MEILLNSVVDETLTLFGTLKVLGGALALGLLISGVYILTHRREGYAPSFVVTLIMLPAIIATIILLVGSNVARAFSLAGAFSLIRFRSAPGNPKDIAYVFFTLAAGLACGMGHLAYGLVFAVVISLVMLLLDWVHFGSFGHPLLQLRVTVPEDLHFPGAFDDILDRHTAGWHQKKVKTVDFGASFEVTYLLRPARKGFDQLALINEIRARNGNLKIQLTEKEWDD